MEQKLFIFIYLSGLNVRSDNNLEGKISSEKNRIFSILVKASKI